MANRSRVENIASNATAGILAKAVTIVAGFVMRVVFLATLGKEYTGISSLFTDILTMISFAELGISSAITYAMYKPVANADHEKVAQLMNFYKKAYRVVAAVVLTVGLAVIPLIRGIVVPKDKIGEINSDPAVVEQIWQQLIIIYILYVVNSAVSYLLIYKSTLLTAHQEHRYVSYVQICVALARVGVETAVLFIFKNYKYGFIIYLVAGILLTRLQNWICSSIASKRYPEVDANPDAKLPKEEQKKIFKDIGGIMIYKLCNTLNASMDSIIISNSFGSIWVGYLSNYRLVTTKLQTVITQFYNSATPSVGNLATMSDDDVQYSKFKSLFFLSFWMLCFCSTSLITLLNPFITIWVGAEYVKGMHLVIILVCVFYFNAIIQPVSTFRTSNGLFTQGRIRPLVMVTLNIILSYSLAKVIGGRYGESWGIFGVKLATVISSLSTMQWFDPMLVYKHVFKRSVKEYFTRYFSYLGVTVASAASTYFISMLIPTAINKYVRFVILAVICLVVPNTIIVLLFRKTTEFKTVIRMIAGLVKRKKKKAIQ